MNNKRPLISVIISCYNAGKYIEYLLDTLVHQGIRKDEYEIIISDDHSSEKYFDKVEKFKKKLNIKTIVADKNWGYPAHTRQQGLNIATGEWITFSDQDDGFFKDAFKQLKKYIKNNSDIDYIRCKTCFGEMKEDGTRISTEEFVNGSVTHGIFIRRDLFSKYDIKYDYEFVKLEEDHQITTELTILRENGYIKEGTPDIYAYCWFIHDASYSHQLGKDKQKLPSEVDFPNFLKATISAYHKYMKKGMINNTMYYTSHLFKLFLWAYNRMNMYKYYNFRYGLQNEEINEIYAAWILKEIYKYILKEDFKVFLFDSSCEKLYFNIMKEFIDLNQKGYMYFYYPMEGILDYIDRLETLFDRIPELEDQFQ